jgi:hypothetical protein
MLPQGPSDLAPASQPHDAALEFLGEPSERAGGPSGHKHKVWSTWDRIRRSCAILHLPASLHHCGCHFPFTFRLLAEANLIFPLYPAAHYFLVLTIWTRNHTF